MSANPAPAPVPAAAMIRTVPRFTGRVARHLAERAIDVATTAMIDLNASRALRPHDTPEHAALMAAQIETVIEHLSFAAAQLRQRAEQP